MCTSCLKRLGFGHVDINCKTALINSVENYVREVCREIKSTFRRTLKYFSECTIRAALERAFEKHRVSNAVLAEHAPEH